MKTDSEQEEMLEAWDWEKAEPAGIAVSRTKAHAEGIPHEGVHLWIIKPETPEPIVLLQRRSMLKLTFPGVLDISVGGHVPFGLREGKVRKEAMEELGFCPEEKDLTDLGISRYEGPEQEGRINREFTHVYVTCSSQPLESYRFADGEVEGLAAVPLNRLRAVMKGEDAGPCLYYDGSSVQTKYLKKKDFHPLIFGPAMAEYMERIFAAAENINKTGH